MNFTLLACAALFAGPGVGRAGPPASTPSSFGPSIELGAGFSAQSIVSADVDLDGRLDLVVANNESNNVSVLFGNGDGTFEGALNLPASTGPSSAQVADVDRDGRPDIVVAHNIASSVLVLRQTSPRQFVAGAQIGTGEGPEGLAVVDLNGDGVVDAVTANFFEVAGTVSVLIGTEQGTFQTAKEFRTAPNDEFSGPIAVISKDLNGDTNADVIVANSDGNTVGILFGIGDGTLSPPITIPVGDAPVAIVAVDVNQDGLHDLAVANEEDSSVSLLLAEGPANFRPASDFPVHTFPEAIAGGDFNLDGRVDLAVANTTATTDAISILRGDGAGSFQPIEDFPIGGLSPLSITVGDFNTDGRPDLATANIDASSEASVSVLINDSDLVGSTFTPTATFTATSQPGALRTISGTVRGDNCQPPIADAASPATCNVIDGSGFTVEAFLATDAGADCCGFPGCARCLVRFVITFDDPFLEPPVVMFPDNSECQTLQPPTEASATFACGNFIPFGFIPVVISGPSLPTRTPSPTNTVSPSATSTPSASPTSPRKQDGLPCTVPGDCQSGFCVDTVCCNSECNLGNDFCNLPGSEGTCISIALPTPTSSPTPKPNLTPQPDGSRCALDQECDSGFCTDSVCCESRCNEEGDVCAVPGFEGQCLRIILTPTITPTASPTTIPCAGECDGDGIVRANDLTAILLGRRELLACPNGDWDKSGEIGQAEVDLAIFNLFDERCLFRVGQPPPPTLTRTRTATSTPTATRTPTASPTLTRTAMPTPLPSGTPTATRSPTPRFTATRTATRARTSTPTRTPTSAISTGCPWTFRQRVDDADRACYFAGFFNESCGNLMIGTWLGDGEIILAVLVSGDTTIIFGASVTSGDRADLIGWDTRLDFSTPRLVSGLMLMVDVDDVRRSGFGIAPTLVPFTIAGCPFDLFAGAFIGIGADIGAGAVFAPMRSPLPHLEQALKTVRKMAEERRRKDLLPSGEAEWKPSGD